MGNSNWICDIKIWVQYHLPRFWNFLAVLFLMCITRFYSLLISIVDHSIQSSKILISSLSLHCNLTRYVDNRELNHFITACSIIQKMGFWCSAMQTLIERLLFILVFNWNTKNNLVEWWRRRLWSITSQNGTEDHN